jgi:hypothetical protein
VLLVIPSFFAAWYLFPFVSSNTFMIRFPPPYPLKFPLLQCPEQQIADQIQFPNLFKIFKAACLISI